MSEEAAIDNTTPLYFGGIPSDYEINLSTAASVKLFVGCLGDATVNGKFQNFADTLDRPGASLASCPLGGPVASPSNTTSPPLIGTTSTLSSPQPTDESVTTQTETNSSSDETIVTTGKDFIN